MEGEGERKERRDSPEGRTERLDDYRAEIREKYPDSTEDKKEQTSSPERPRDDERSEGKDSERGEIRNSQSNGRGEEAADPDGPPPERTEKIGEAEGKDQSRRLDEARDAEPSKESL